MQIKDTAIKNFHTLFQTFSQELSSLFGIKTLFFFFLSDVKLIKWRASVELKFDKSHSKEGF